jgi:hypothetical protein
MHLRAPNDPGSSSSGIINYLKSLDSRCSLPLSVVIEGGNDGSKQIRGFYEFIRNNDENTFQGGYDFKKKGTSTYLLSVVRPI